jgi:hypothetical protein
VVKTVAETATGTADVVEVEVPVNIGAPSRTRTLDPLIKSDPESRSTEIQDDGKLDDLYTWE